MTTAQITIDDRFFQIAGAQSSRYPRLWTIAKETMQNSQDAEATLIEFDTDDDWVGIEDNGPGMDPTGGIENFLTIGASQKNEQDSATGFFSTAKVRICFIHKDWSIWTNDQFLRKSMLNNEPIRKTDDVLNGCRLEIQSSNGPWEAQAIEDYFNLCTAKLSVKLNGKKLRRKFRPGGLKANFDWADVYVNRGEKAKRGTLIVRVNGLCMFTEALPGVNAQVTVELDPEMSRHLLQENREGLVWSTKLNGSRIYPESELRRFINGLIVNPSSAKPKSKTVLEFVKGSRYSQSTKEVRYTDTTDEPTNELDHRMESIKIQGQPPLIGELVPTNLKEALANLKDAELAQIVEMLDPKQAKFEEIFPYDYVVKHEGRRPNPHTKHARLLAAWKGIAEAIAQVNGISTDWGVGLLVNQGSKAEWVETNWGDYLMVDYRTAKMTGSQLAETLKLVRLACHELTHALGYTEHNERFIVKESELYETALENLSKVRKASKGLTIYSRGYGKN